MSDQLFFLNYCAHVFLARGFSDLLILNVNESYRNLPYKTLFGFDWMRLWMLDGNEERASLPNIDWFVKTDDDINVDWLDFLVALESGALQESPQDDFLYCHYVLHNRFPVRDPRDKM